MASVEAGHVQHGGQQPGGGADVFGGVLRGNDLGAVERVGHGQLLQVLPVAVPVRRIQGARSGGGLVQDVVAGHAGGHADGVEEGFDQERADRLARLLFQHRRQEVEAVAVVTVAVPRRALGRVGEQVFDPDRVTLYVGDIPGHGFVQVELALLRQLQHQRRGERLGERGDVVERLRRRGDFLFHVGEPEALAPKDFLVPDDDRGHARDLQQRADLFDLLFKALQPLPVLLRRRRAGHVAPVPIRRDGDQQAQDGPGRDPVRTVLAHRMSSPAPTVGRSAASPLQRHVRQPARSKVTGSQLQRRRGVPVCHAPTAAWSPRGISRGAGCRESIRDLDAFRIARLRPPSKKKESGEVASN